jgi:arylsulfatase A-like enzyme
MEEAGLWNSSALIVTSDHGWRGNNQSTNKLHVPLIIKLPNSEKPFSYTPQIHTFTLFDFTREFLAGRIANNRQLTEWFDDFQNGSRQAARKF